MASKFMFFHMLLALAMFASEIEGGGVLPTIRFIDVVSGKSPLPIKLGIKAGGSVKGSVQLDQGQAYQINVDVDEVYYVSATSGLQFAAFHAYEPARDTGRAAVYWKADNQGFSISYDNIKWNKAADWESD